LFVSVVFSLFVFFWFSIFLWGGGGTSNSLKKELRFNYNISIEDVECHICNIKVGKEGEACLIS
jgi:hypothetical protein